MSYALSVAKSKPQKEILSKFNKFGIGVYLKDEKGFKTIKKARLSEMPVNIDSIFFNEWIGRILNMKEGTHNAV